MKWALIVVVVLVVVVVLFTVVFPWVDRMLADPVMSGTVVDVGRSL